MTDETPPARASQPAAAPADVIELTRAFYVFVSSALREGASMAILDAMAAAKPVVATETGNIPEVVVDGSTGFIAPPRNNAALAERIVTPGAYSEICAT